MQGAFMTEPDALDEDRIEQQLLEIEDNPKAPHETTIANLHKDLETLAQDLRAPAPADPHENESACRQAVEKVQTLASQETALPTGTGSGSASGLERGTVLGQYRILAKLGQGGMGAVYKALHTKLEKTVALKVLPEDRLGKSDAIARFHREMKAVGKIEHPHLVRALDAGEADGSHYLVMEYVDGLDLSRLVKEQGKLPIAAACELIRQAALGLQAAHQRGMVHRDIKPANLMLARQDYGPPVVKVLDLGLARLVDESGTGETELTTDNQIMGTLDFMAPEQADSIKDVDTRADVYSLGATLFTLLTGRPPYHATGQQSFMQKLSALANAPLPNVRNQRPDVPSGLVAVLEKMLAKARDKRFKEPIEVAKALEPFAIGANLAELLDDAKTQATHCMMPHSTATWAVPSTSPTLLMPKPSRKRPALLAGIALLILVPFLLLYAGTIIRFATNQGELVIEVDDPSIEVQIIQNGAIVKDKTKDREFTLTATNGEIKVLGDGIKVLTKEFQLTRGGKTIVNVTQELVDARKPKPVLENSGDAHSGSYAVSFDGQDDYVTIQTLTIDIGKPLTIEAEVTVAKPPENGAACLVHVDGYFRIVAQQYGQGQPVWAAGGYDAANAGITIPSDPGAFAIQKRTFVAAVYDRGKITLFVDGRRMDSPTKAFQDGKITDVAGPVELTKHGQAGTTIGVIEPRQVLNKLRYAFPFQGQIHRVRISNVARYTEDFTPPKRFEPDEHTLALYHFDEGQGDVLKDSSGNGHHGKIVGATWVNLNADREAAEWLLSKGGEFDLIKDGTYVTVRDSKDIPSGPFTVVKVSLQGIQKVNDADMARLTALSGLKHLYLHGTGITDAGLAKLARVQTLGELHLHGTQVTDAGLKHLSGLKHLFLLYLYKTRITDAGLNHLTGLPNLRYLSLNQTQVTDAGLVTLSKLAGLRVLHLESTETTDKGLKSLHSLKLLETVTLKGTQVTEEGIAQLHKALPACRIEWDGGVVGPKTESTDRDREVAEWAFSLGANRIDIKGDERRYARFEELPSTPYKLHLIDLSEVIVSDAQMAMFDGLDELVMLSLNRYENRQSPLSDEGLKRLGHLPKLAHLSLVYHNITDEGLRELARFPNLIRINLMGTKVTDEGLKHLAVLPGLRGVDVGWTQVTGTGLRHLAGCANMDTVWLWNSPVTDEGLLSFPPWPKLGTLTVNGSRITDRSVRVIGRFPNLRKLWLHNATRITPEGWKVLGDLKHLEELNLEASAIDDSNLELLTKLTSLKSLNLNKTKVSKAGVESLHNALPKCKITWDGGVVEPKMESQ